MLAAAQAIAAAEIELEGTLAIAAVPGEESGGWGTKSMVNRRDWDAVVIGEPTQLSINPACNGITAFWIKILGQSAHASTPEKGINAIDNMLVVLNALEKYKEKLRSREHPLTGIPAFVSCIISGGWRDAVVPDECKLLVSTHLVPGETVESRLAEVMEMLKELNKKDPELTAEVLDLTDRPITLPLPKPGPHTLRLDPTEISVDEPIVRAMLQASKDALGKELPIRGSRYACDSPYLVNEGKIPTLVFGPGSIDQAHRENEWVEVEQLVDAAKVYAIAAIRFLKG